MIARILEFVTGKDDFERVAYTENLERVNEYLKKRPLFFPIKPRRFLDAATFTQEELLELVKQGSEELDSDRLTLWILDIDGQKRLPAFSNRKRMETFSGKMSQRINKVFSLGCFEALVPDIAKQVDVDFIDVNLFSQKSWEIGIAKYRKQPS